MKKAVHEILEEANSHSLKEDRIAVLHRHSKDIKWLLDYSYNPKIKWLLPKGEANFEPTQDSDGATIARLYHNARKIPIFLESGPYPKMDRMKRERLFIQLLEDLHVKEAKLLCKIKDGEMLKDYKKLSMKLIEKAFPILTESWKQKND